MVKWRFEEYLKFKLFKLLLHWNDLCTLTKQHSIFCNKTSGYHCPSYDMERNIIEANFNQPCKDHLKPCEEVYKSNSAYKCKWYLLYLPLKLTYNNVWHSVNEFYVKSDNFISFLFIRYWLCYIFRNVCVDRLINNSFICIY